MPASSFDFDVVTGPSVPRDPAPPPASAPAKPAGTPPAAPRSR
jgi:hypothetical protein